MSDLLRPAGSAWFTQGFTGGGSPGGGDTEIQFNSSGSFAGSSSFVYNGSTLTYVGVVNFSGGEITLNSGSDAIYLTCLSSVYIGDVRPDGNGTLLTIDDQNQRATFNKKFVLTDTGSFYIYDAGTSTYWKWESVSGVWTPTDTGSASLP